MVWLFSSLNEGAKNSVFKGSGGAISKALGTVKDAFVKSTNAVAYGAGKIGLRTPLIVGGVLAAGVGVATFLGRKRADKAKESQMALRDNQMEAMKADIIANQQAMAQPAIGANTMMGLQPVAGDHANRVLAARNGGMGVDTSNPNMTAANFEAAR